MTTKSSKKTQRFSDYFQLNKSQAELDFVDVPLSTDIRLYVDPYALHVSGQDWLRECGNNIVEYFEILLEKIRKGQNRDVLQLLDNFHEPRPETHLGQSSGLPAGKGWGQTESKKLANVLRASAAVKSGKLSDLGDYEMFIPGIGPDKISDLATNIIKSDLLIYTKEQCDLFGIPTSNVSAGKCWDAGTKSFISKYAELPVCHGMPKLLVPKTAVRTRLLATRDKFYSQHILDYLEAELISANDSLVKTLKNGKKRIYKKDLKKRFGMDAEQIFRFSQEHPQILKQYKDSLPTQAKPITNIDIEWSQPHRRTFDICSLSDDLKGVQPGTSSAGIYHNTILGILSAVFYPTLTRPKKEKEINEGRKRIDILFENSAEKGFFSRIVNAHKIFAPYVSVECKNYSEDPENPELDQLIGRFSDKRGDFGFLICRKIDKPSLMVKRCRDVVNSGKGVIIALDDQDILNLLSFADKQDTKAIDDYLSEKLLEILS